MSVEVASPTPASTPAGSIFDDDWKSFGGGDQNEFENLDDMSLDDILGPPPKPASTAGTINPQILNGDASPETRPDNAHCAQVGEEGNIIVGPALQTEAFDQHPIVSSSYFHPSIEAPYPVRTAYAPLGFQLPSQLHRRSVSEPPAGHPSEHLHAYTVPSIPEPALTFTRAGINIGTPKLHHGNRATRSRHPHLHEPYPTLKPFGQERYHLRRTHTQPVRAGPTSVPPMHPIHQTQSPQMRIQSPPGSFQHVPMQGVRAVTSRVCTPAPSPPQQHVSPVQIDPRLMTASGGEKKAVTIPLTVEELREMITEAVSAALLGAGVRNSVEDAGIPQDDSAGVKEEQD